MLEARIVGPLIVLRTFVGQIKVMHEGLADVLPTTAAEICISAVLTDYDVSVVLEGVAQCPFERPDYCESGVVIIAIVSWGWEQWPVGDYAEIRVVSCIEAVPQKVVS